MKTRLSSLCFSLLLTASLSGADAARKANLTILDATGVQNLRIQTAVVEASDFEETIFALGRIEAKPGNSAAVTSRISGRVVALSALPGDKIAANAEVLKVESRQPGQPAPTIALTAPLGGTVTRVEVRLGDPVEPDRALLEITDLGEVIAVARVPEHAAGRIQPDATAHITLAAWPDRKMAGRLLRFGTAADATGGTLDAIFVLPNTEGLIRPGMRAEFSIVLEKRPNVVSVPRAALQGEPASRFVYVKDFDLPNAFLKTPVVVGQSNDRFVEIIRGLLPADEVVTQGAYSLAFAGGGSLSLKDALDAAHGHAHAEDGSELKPNQAKKSTAPAAAGSDHGHDHGDDHAHPQRPWQILSAVLFIALLFVGFRKKAAAPRAQN
ncbi:MAG: efflux RND transporter periplasmic adaptor subunit [Opitutaceae bacterium]|nr:efflux RND transporter periplasmic adaptor subunit [Opitutaceae bacterium]